MTENDPKQQGQLGDAESGAAEQDWWDEVFGPFQPVVARSARDFWDFIAPRKKALPPWEEGPDDDDLPF